MLSLQTLRRLCAAVDAFAITCIAAGISKSRTKTDFAVYANASNHCPENFPTIAACKAAVLRNRSSPNSEFDQQISSAEDLDRKPPGVDQPALLKIKAEKDPERLFHLFKANAHNRLVVENRFAFEDTVSRLAGARRFDLVENLLEHQKTLPQGRREGFVVRIISLYGRAGMPDHALRTFDEMPLYGCTRTAKSFNATLKVLSQARRFDDIQIFFDEAPAKYGIELDKISYNTIIKAMCEMGRLDTAYLVMLAMQKAEPKPDVVTYTTLISAFYKHGRHEIGDGLWNLMKLRGCSPNLATYNVRIQYLVNRRRTWQANDLVRSMYVSGIKPDEVTYNLIIKGFFMMGELEMAKRVFYATHGRGCKPNSKIYQTMVHYLCKGKEFDLAFRLCKDSMERNWFPSVDTICRLLKGLVKISKDRNAREVMKLVRGRVPSYSANDMKAFEDILSVGRMRKLN
ncbi:pentatricopeptide repeat-containing protein At1g80150, mitochondrial [Ananas comosus]|uniref:Pentatricopeptide repeat-containing protein At1g80150, mitochondrial n=2 Tax=Ananas comosus TaxID=4615 RepID=A0A199VDT0_ANACO|nr:pentatricopeptide repeat-containing protein At1g80150, mitochondrial [Ananas comosus]OAY75036.1 Pentatricopeptide repeat-containing protein, mitochondrial [Ananas comosus]